MSRERITVRATINGTDRELRVRPDIPALYVLRNDLGLVGTRLGCGQGECGACMILLDGLPTRSCLLPIEAVADHRVTTVEGLGSEDEPHPVQSAVLAEQAGQCGYCLSGIVVTSSTLKPESSEGEVRAALDKHLCRCGTHGRIVRAVLRGLRTEQRS